MSGWTTLLLAGLAEHLAADGVGLWRPTGTYAAGETGIVIAAMPPDPERIVCLTMYPVAAMAATADVTVAVQVRTRAGKDPRDVDDLADAVWQTLHGAAHLMWGGIPVVQVLHRSGSPMGRDQLDRWERSDNYYVDTIRPGVGREH